MNRNLSMLLVIVLVVSAILAPASAIAQGPPDGKGKPPKEASLNYVALGDSLATGWILPWITGYV